MWASSAPPSAWSALCIASPCCAVRLTTITPISASRRDLLELRNLVDCAELIVRSALLRHESRGLHYSRDYPLTLPVSFPTVLMAERGLRKL